MKTNAVITRREILALRSPILPGMIPNDEYDRLLLRSWAGQVARVCGAGWLARTVRNDRFTF
jgi:hypothetical protein